MKIHLLPTPSRQGRRVYYELDAFPIFLPRGGGDEGEASPDRRRIASRLNFLLLELLPDAIIYRSRHLARLPGMLQAGAGQAHPETGRPRQEHLVERVQRRLGLGLPEGALDQETKIPELRGNLYPKIWIESKFLTNKPAQASLCSIQIIDNIIFRTYRSDSEFGINIAIFFGRRLLILLERR